MSRVKDLMGTGTAPIAALNLNSCGTVVSAGTGSQAAGKLLDYAANNLTTAGSLDTFVLPTGAQGSMPGDVIYAYTPGATTGVVYPGGADTINGSTSAVSIAQAKMGVFTRFTSTSWGFTVTA